MNKRKKQKSANRPTARKYVATLGDLMAAVSARKAIVVPYTYGDRRIPAAFIACMQARLVYDMLRRNPYIYERRTK